jgi:hypothetical protein
MLSFIVGFGAAYILTGAFTAWQAYRHDIGTAVPVTGSDWLCLAALIVLWPGFWHWITNDSIEDHKW